MLVFGTSNSKSEVSKSSLVENNFFPENYVTSEGLFYSLLSMFCTINSNIPKYIL